MCLSWSCTISIRAVAICVHSWNYGEYQSNYQTDRRTRAFSMGDFFWGQSINIVTRYYITYTFLESFYICYSCVLIVLKLFHTLLMRFYSIQLLVVFLSPLISDPLYRHPDFSKQKCLESITVLQLHLVNQWGYF